MGGQAASRQDELAVLIGQAGEGSKRLTAWLNDFLN